MIHKLIHNRLDGNLSLLKNDMFQYYDAFKVVEMKGNG